MLYELNGSDIDYYYDLFEKHTYMNKLLDFIDFDNDINEELIRKCIYKKMYNPGKIVGKEYVKQLAITKEQKKIFLKEFDIFFDAIFKKHSITFSKEVFLLSVYIFIILFFFKPINNSINGFVGEYTGGWLSDILLYNHTVSGIKIGLGTFLFLALLFVLLSYLVGKIEIINEEKKQ